MKVVATQSDLRGLKEEVMVQREEIKRLEGLYTYLQKELLRKKEEKQQELTASLLNHFRSTVESRVKDVQRRVREGEWRER